MKLRDIRSIIEFLQEDYSELTIPNKGKLVVDNYNFYLNGKEIDYKEVKSILRYMDENKVVAHLVTKYIERDFMVNLVDDIIFNLNKGVEVQGILYILTDEFEWYPEFVEIIDNINTDYNLRERFLKDGYLMLKKDGNEYHILIGFKSDPRETYNLKVNEYNMKNLLHYLMNTAVNFVFKN